MSISKLLTSEFTLTNLTQDINTEPHMHGFLGNLTFK